MDEALHLAAAFQLAGFRAMVAAQRVSESAYIAPCFQVRMPSGMSNTAETALLTNGWLPAMRLIAFVIPAAINASRKRSGGT